MLFAVSKTEYILNYLPIFNISVIHFFDILLVVDLGISRLEEIIILIHIFDPLYRLSQRNRHIYQTLINLKAQGVVVK